MSIHYGLFSKTTSSTTDLSDLEKKVADVRKTADTNKSTIAVHDVTVRANEKDLVLVNTAITSNTSSISTNTTNISSITTKANSNYSTLGTHRNKIDTNELDIISNASKIAANKTSSLDNAGRLDTHTTDIAKLKKHFAYHFSFYYVNLAYNTWHSPEIMKLGWNASWLYFDTPTENTKVKLMGQSFDDDSAIHTRSRIKMEHKVFISKTDNSTEEAQLFHDDILSKRLEGKNFYINEEKSLKDIAHFVRYSGFFQQ